jgi:DNA-binding CsgD family transcriptional regulator
MAGRQRAEADRAPSGGRAPVAVARPRELPLIGRTAQLEALEREVTRARAGQFRVVLLRAGAGLGKTRLVAEVLARHADEATCLSARSYRWGSAASFGPWVEALDRWLRDVDAERIVDLCGPWLHDLAGLLGTVRAVAGPTAAPTGRERLLEGLATVLERLGAERPVLIALDDVHLADSSTWEAVRFLGRHLEQVPVTVLLTARPSPLDEHPIALETLVRLEEDAHLTRVGLEPLARPEVTELVHEVLRAEPTVASSFVTDPLVGWLLDRSLGHPLFVIGLLRALIEEGADLTAPRLERLPTSLRERVVLDLGGLAAGQRELLDLLAVADRRMDVRDLDAALGRAPHVVGEDVEVLTRSHLVVERGGPTSLTYEIAHPIIQETVYEAIGGSRRRDLHRTVAAALLEAGHLGAAAGHLARGAEAGDLEAIEQLCRAMDQAESRGLYRESLATLDALVGLLPEDDSRWSRLLEVMNWQPEWVLSHLAENDAPTAIVAMRRIDRQLGGEADPAERATVQFHLAAFLSFGAGRIEEAEQASRAAVELFTAAGEEERALLATNELAWLCGCAGSLRRQAAIAGEVLEEAIRMDHPRAVLQATATRAYALGFLGRFREADELFTRAVRLARREGNTYRAAWSLSQQASVLGLAGRLPEATSTARAALAEDLGAPDALANENLAQSHWLAGRLADALVSLEEASVRRTVRGSRRRAWGAALGARLHAEAGRQGRARTSLEQATATYGGRPFLVWGFWEPWTAGLLAWQEERPQAALASYEVALEQLGAADAVPYELLVRAERAELTADATAHAHAARDAARLEELATTLEGAGPVALAELGIAWSRLALGEHASATAAAERAVAALQRAGHALHRASALHALGRARQPEDRPGAAVALQEAAEAFEDCGALWRRQRVLSDLSRLGSRGRRAAAAVTGPSSLTGREREVATLTVLGYTAAEVGTQLFIGRRTVESHLASCYAKLGVRSKGELIRRARELELVEELRLPPAPG